MIKPSSLGKLPSEWTNKKFGEITKVRQGLQIPISERLLVPTATSKEYITIQSINRHNQEREYVESPSSRVTCTTDDVLMTRTGNTGIVVTGVEGVFHNNFFLIDFDKSKINTVFLVNYLTSPRVQHVIQVNAGASTIPDLNHKDFYSIEFPLAPILEQNEIAQILSTWDKAITTTEQLLSNSQQQKKALMQQLLTGKKRLLDDNGQRFSGEWAVSALAELSTVTKGKQINRDTLSDSGDYAVINGGIEPSGYTSSFNTLANTITISEGGNSCGYVAYQERNFWCGGHCYAVTRPSISNEFIYQALKHCEFKIMSLRVGSGLPNIQKKAIDGFKIKYPENKEEQQKIAIVLTAADNEITRLQQKLDQLKQEKKALMQQLLTGKRRVKVEEVA